jgi:cytoskeleton protein RodZ
MSEAARVSSVHAGAAAGALLGAAREASGMSIDTVAQQLKLAPRQVRALEAGEFSHLPGRTFVRGFIRNYARLLRLDPEQVLGALPAGGAMPSLEAPTLHPTAPAMGELPTTVEPSKAGWTRWAIPLTLAAVVAAAAVYEWKRPVASIRPAQAKEAVAPSVPATDSVPPDKTEAPLANPAAGTAPVTAPTSPEAATASAPAPADSKGAGRAP